MDKEKIKEVIISNQEFVEHISLKERTVKISDNFNYIFVGIRRCGKSYLALISSFTNYEYSII